MATATKKATTVKKPTTTAKTVKKLTPKEITENFEKKGYEVFRDGGVYCIKHNGKWGFADASGEIKIKPKFDGIGEDWVEDIITTWGKDGLGFVNKKLEEIVKPKYGQSRAFHNGFAAVGKNLKWGFIDKNGKEVVPLIYDDVENFKGDKAKVKLGSKEFYIDKKGKPIDDTKKTTPAKTTTTKSVKKLTPKEIVANFEKKGYEVFRDGGVYCIKHNGKWGFADASGEIKIKPKFDGIGEDWVEDIITTWGKDGLGFVNKKLEEIVKPKYGQSRAFHNGFAAVGKNLKWGFIDKNGKEVVPLIYDDVENFKGDKAKVKLGSKEFYIDKKGKIVK